MEIHKDQVKRRGEAEAPDRDPEFGSQDTEKKRYEDVFQSVLEKFAGMAQFKKFARSSAGLGLREKDIGTICEDNKGDSNEMQLKMLWLWKQNNHGRDRTSDPEKILDIVDKYLRPDDENSMEPGVGNSETANQTVPDATPPKYPKGPSRGKEEPTFTTKVKKCGKTENQPPERIRHEPAAANDNMPNIGIFRHAGAPWLTVFAFLFGGAAVWLAGGNTMLQPDSNVKDECGDYDTSVQSFMWKVNNATHKKASAYSVAELKKPQFRIFPETVVVNFYNTPAIKQGYVPELGFTQQVPWMGGQPTCMNDFFKHTDSHVTRYVALVGGVGYGKTEMLKRFSLDVLEHLNPTLEEVEIVHFINLRDLVPEENVTPNNLLFSEMGLTDSEIGCGIQFIKRNPRKFLFVIDGIDQYSEKLERCVSFTSEKGRSSTILSALLCGRLFPDVRILISSREHAIRHFGGDMRPDKVIALAGFTLESVEKLVRTLGSNDGERIWKHLSTRSPTLLSVSSIPMFLVFSVLVLKDRKQDEPETLTEVLMHLLHYHISSKHVDENILHLISKLKPMSFHGTKNGEVTFTLSDLPIGVTIEGAKDLMIPLTGIKARNQRLFDGHFQIHFCHQSLQEALTALHVAEMPVDEFEKFVNDELHKPTWVIVRRLVCGLLLNQKTNSVARGLDPTVGLLNTRYLTENSLQKKQEILKNSLENQLVELQGDGRLRQDLLELLHTLHESDESVRGVIVRSAIEEINFLNVPLTQSDFHVLISTLNHCPKLMLLSVINCKLNMNQMNALTKAFKNPNCDFQVRILLLGNYEKNLPHDGARAVLDLLPFVTDLFWIGYRVEPSDIEMLQTELNALGPTNKDLTIVCWSRETKRLVMLKQQEGKATSQKPTDTE